jgi:hypothetical protein
VAVAVALPPFLTGTKALYNFEFDLAGEAFRESQNADPGFALAYWGEAMSSSRNADFGLRAV